MASEKVALFDRVNYFDRDDQRRTAARGEKLVNPKDREVERLEELGAIGSEDDAELAAAAATAGPLTTSDVTDEELGKLSVEDTVAHLQQFPGDADRVDTLEEARSKRRTGVDDALAALRGEEREERS